MKNVKNGEEQSDFSPKQVVLEKVDTLIFDIGGIIVEDTDEALWRALNIGEQQGRELVKLIYRDPRWTDVLKGKLACNDYLEMLKLENPKQANLLGLSLGYEFHAKTAPLHQENWEFLQNLHKTGNYKMYWLSNRCDNEDRRLDELGVSDGLDGGIFSCREHYKKPEPEFYQILLDRFGLQAEQCLFFDDKERNLEVARELGMQGVLVPRIGELRKIVKTALEM